MERSIRAFGMLVLALGWCITGPPASANTRSVNVVIIGGSVLDTNTTCANSGSQANVAGWTAGGCVAVSGPAAEFTPLGDFSLFNFSAMAPAGVSSTTLAAYDTAVLMMASSALACTGNSLSAQAKTDIINFVGSGKKLIIYDSECDPGPNYSWLPYPFTTANPGAMGAAGTLSIVEQNTLSKSDSTSPYYIDAYDLGHNIDAVGDMNVMTTYDPNWKLDMAGTNYLNVTGPVHTYAVYPAGMDVGLIIYNGMDQDYQSIGTPNRNLRKTWFLELLEPFNPSNLAGTVTVVGISLAPATATNPPGRAHTVTATLTDLLGNPKPNLAVAFTVAGANAAAIGTCAPATCMTDAAGHVTFTYTGVVQGTDQIKGCFMNGGIQICSSAVTKIWTTKCDVDSNLAINSLDIAAIMAARNTAASGPGDPRDADSDGTITILDARACVLRCDKPNCAR